VIFLTVQTKTFPIQKCQDISSSVNVSLGITWNGDLQSARVLGTLKVGFVSMTGSIEGVVKVNGNEVGSFNMHPLSVIEAEGQFDFDITNYLVSGTNTIDVWARVQWGFMAFWYACINNGSLVVTADDITVIPPTTPTDYIKIVIIGGLFVAAIAVVGYAAGKIAPSVRHRRD